jgi:hypothetical protein
VKSEFCASATNAPLYAKRPPDAFTFTEIFPSSLFYFTLALSFFHLSLRIPYARLMYLSIELLFEVTQEQA